MLNRSTRAGRIRGPIFLSAESGSDVGPLKGYYYCKREIRSETLLLVFLPGALLNELCFVHEGARPVGKAGAQREGKGKEKEEDLLTSL